MKTKKPFLEKGFTSLWPKETIDLITSSPEYLTVFIAGQFYEKWKEKRRWNPVKSLNKILKTFPPNKR